MVKTGLALFAPAVRPSRPRERVTIRDDFLFGARKEELFRGVRVLSNPEISLHPSYANLGAGCPEGAIIHMNQTGDLNPRVSLGVTMRAIETFTRAVCALAVVSMVVGCGGGGEDDRNSAPDARAGSDQRVEERTVVTLDGSASSDSDGTISSWRWSQVSNGAPAVTLAGSASVRATFQAPEVTADTTLEFQLWVEDDDGAADTDRITVTVTDASAGIIVSEVSGHVAIPGATARFTVRLASRSSANVTIPVRSSDESQGEAEPAQLVFTPDDWSRRQTVMVRGTDPDARIGEQNFVIHLGPSQSLDPLYDRIQIADVEMNVFELPLRSVHLSGNWATNRQVVDEWEAAGTGPLIPPDYIEYLKSLHVNWIGISVALHYEDSMDSTVERVYSSDVDIPTFSDAALRQLIREFTDQGFDVYLTLAFEAHEAETAARPVLRWQLGDPAPPHTGGVPPDDPNEFGLILPENWPWRPDHPEHSRFVSEFWETYTRQAVHFARIAEEEGARLYSLGTETDRLFRTRSGGYMTNDYRRELESMVNRVRAVYTGLLTYDMHYSALMAPDFFGPGSDYLWEDLDLDVAGISAWFPLTDSPPSTVMSVESLQASYGRIFRDHLVPLMERNPGRPIVFTEYGATDTVETPAAPGDASALNRPFAFEDLNGNGLDDGRETQANVYQALLNTMGRNPGVVNGVFWWDNWIASDAMWAENWASRRSYAIRDRLAEEVVRSAYEPLPVPETYCADYEELTSPGFIYSNNVWGKGGITDYEQCLLKRVFRGDTQYGWRWRWPYGSGHNVKAYPEVIYGHKPVGIRRSSSTTSDLPRRISSISELRADYEVEMTATGIYNLAFEMWVTSGDPPTPENITHEILIEVDRDRTFEPQPSDFQVGQVEIDGMTYDLYVNPESPLGKFIVFTSHADQLGGTLDFRKFLDYLVDHSHVPADHYVTSVELGNEVIEGAGETWLKSYRITVD